MYIVLVGLCFIFNKQKHEMMACFYCVLLLPDLLCFAAQNICLLRRFSIGYLNISRHKSWLESLLVR